MDELQREKIIAASGWQFCRDFMTTDEFGQVKDVFPGIHMAYKLEHSFRYLELSGAHGLLDDAKWLVALGRKLPLFHTLDAQNQPRESVRHDLQHALIIADALDLVLLDRDNRKIKEDSQLSIWQLAVRRLLATFL